MIKTKTTHPPKECIMYEMGYARRVYLQKDSDLPKGYLQSGEMGFPEKYTGSNGVILCEVKKNRCPYNQEGEPILDFSSNLGIMRVCNSNGFVPLQLELVANKR